MESIVTEIIHCATHAFSLYDLIFFTGSDTKCELNIIANYTIYGTSCHKVGSVNEAKDGLVR